MKPKTPIFSQLSAATTFVYAIPISRAAMGLRSPKGQLI